MDTWPIIVFISVSSLVVGLLLFKTQKSTKQLNQASVAFILFYGSISSSVIIIIVSVYHLHRFWGPIVHFHPIQHITNIILFSIFGLDVDLLSIISVNLTLFLMIFSFTYSQIKLRIILSNLLNMKSLELSKILVNNLNLESSIELIVVNGNVPIANSFTLLRFKYWRFYSQDWIVVSSGLIEMLTWDELETTIWHEYGHITEQDTRYSHLLVTLSSIIKFDPILKIVGNILNFRHEVEADLISAKITGKPKILASALLKLMEFGINQKLYNPVTSILGHSKNDIIKRINILLKLPTSQLFKLETKIIDG